MILYSLFLEKKVIRSYYVNMRRDNSKEASSVKLERMENRTENCLFLLRGEKVTAFS